MRAGLVMLAVVLSGCATAAQRQVQAIRAQNEAVVATAKACITEVYNSPEGAALRKRRPLDMRDATIAQLTDASLATPEEIRAILITHPRAQACYKAALDGMLISEPGIVPILTRQFAAGEDDLISLMQHKLSWGDAVRRARDRAISVQADILAEERRMMAGLREEHQAELARRQAAANALAQWAQTQQVISAMNRPVVTTCAGMGAAVNCVSR